MGLVIKLLGVTKAFGKQRVLDDVSFSVGEKEIVSIIGPSGSGKTTLIRIIAGLEKPDVGTVSLPQSRSDVGVVFQDFNLWPHKTVIENICEAPILVNKISKENAIKEAHEWLAKVGLSHKAHHYPHQLSGGEKQRTAIARSLIMKPRVLLLDEITSNLDPQIVQEMNQLLKKLSQENYTILLVSHDHQFVKGISDRVILLKDGRIAQGGPVKTMVGKWPN